MLRRDWTSPAWQSSCQRIREELDHIGDTSYPYIWAFCWAQVVAKLLVFARRI